MNIDTPTDVEVLDSVPVETTVVREQPSLQRYGTDLFQTVKLVTFPGPTWKIDQMSDGLTAHFVRPNNFPKFPDNVKGSEFAYYLLIYAADLMKFLGVGLLPSSEVSAIKMNGKRLPARSSVIDFSGLSNVMLRYDLENASYNASQKTFERISFPTPQQPSSQKTVESYKGFFDAGLEAQLFNTFSVYYRAALVPIQPMVQALLAIPVRRGIMYAKPFDYNRITLVRRPPSITAVSAVLASYPFSINVIASRAADSFYTEIFKAMSTTRSNNDVTNIMGYNLSAVTTYNQIGEAITRGNLEAGLRTVAKAVLYPARYEVCLEFGPQYDVVRYIKLLMMVACMPSSIFSFTTRVRVEAYLSLYGYKIFGKNPTAWVRQTEITNVEWDDITQLVELNANTVRYGTQPIRDFRRWLHPDNQGNGWMWDNPGLTDIVNTGLLTDSVVGTRIESRVLWSATDNTIKNKWADFMAIMTALPSAAGELSSKLNNALNMLTLIDVQKPIDDWLHDLNNLPSRLIPTSAEKEPLVVNPEDLFTICFNKSLPTDDRLHPNVELLPMIMEDMKMIKSMETISSIASIVIKHEQSDFCPGDKMNRDQKSQAVFEIAKRIVDVPQEMINAMFEPIENAFLHDIPIPRGHTLESKLLDLTYTVIRNNPLDYNILAPLRTAFVTHLTPLEDSPITETVLALTASGLSNANFDQIVNSGRLVMTINQIPPGQGGMINYYPATLSTDSYAPALETNDSRDRLSSVNLKFHLFDDSKIMKRDSIYVIAQVLEEWRQTRLVTLLNYRKLIKPVSAFPTEYLSKSTVKPEDYLVTKA
jgi:hypothetical protein